MTPKTSISLRWALEHHFQRESAHRTKMKSTKRIKVRNTQFSFRRTHEVAPLSHLKLRVELTSHARWVTRNELESFKYLNFQVSFPEMTENVHSEQGRHVCQTKPTAFSHLKSEVKIKRFPYWSICALSMSTTRPKLTDPTSSKGARST